MTVITTGDVKMHTWDVNCRLLDSYLTSDNAETSDNAGLMCIKLVISCVKDTSEATYSANMCHCTELQRPID